MPSASGLVCAAPRADGEDLIPVSLLGSCSGAHSLTLCGGEMVQSGADMRSFSLESTTQRPGNLAATAPRFQQTQGDKYDSRWRGP